MAEQKIGYEHGAGKELNHPLSDKSDGHMSAQEAAAARKASRSVGAASAWLNGIVLWAALAVFSTAYSVAIIGSTLGQPTFAERFGFATHANITQLISAAVGGGQAAGFVGQFVASYLSDKIGRKYSIAVFCVLLIIGDALSGGCANGSWGMFIFARCLVGFGGWPLAALALTYQSEVAIAEIRGWLAGTVGLAFGLGYTTAGWFSVAFFYWNSVYAWRVPLILGIIFPLITLGCLPFVPETPRWLCMNGRAEEAYPIIERMHRSATDPTHSYARHEYAEIKAQAAYDITLDSSWIGLWKKPSMRRRAILISVVAAVGQNTGIQVITSYGPTLYAGFGFSAADSLLIAGGWITIAAWEPIIVAWLCDKIGRRPLLIAAPALCTISITIIGVLTKYYGTPTGTVGSGQAALIAFFYLHIIFYLLCEATVYIYYGEVFPNHCISLLTLHHYYNTYQCYLYAREGSLFGFGIYKFDCSVDKSFWVVSLSFPTDMAACLHETWATPTALVTIGYKYWFVYTALNFVGALYLWYAVKETRGVPLEEIAELFGDAEDVQMHLATVHKMAEAEMTGLK